MAKEIIVRFPPSPTGPFHVGNARTALFNYLFAKQNGGKILFRLEDTDKERSKKEYEDDIINGLKWLGIDLDFKKIIRQSERAEIYKKYLQKMIGDGNAYISKEEAGEGKRGEVIRFKNPNKKIKFSDMIRGEIEFDTTELKDFVIAKSLEEPVYHLAVVVDDFEMGVTHIIRGEDGISNTPRQILIQEAIGAPRPVYAHLPLVLAPDRSKLSKRKHGEIVSLAYYKKLGYLPEAMVNFLALLGWNPGTDKEIFSMDELIKEFDISKVQKSGAIFNMEKLDWTNSFYIKKTSTEDLIELCAPYLEKEKIKKIIGVQKERMNKLSDISKDINYFFEQPRYEKEKLLWRTEKDLSKTKKHLEEVAELIGDEKAIRDYAEKEGRGNVLWPFRMALTGEDKSPDPFVVAEILGKEETIKRIKHAVSKI
jgi:glutamyl-tRNA synthetase